MNDDDLSHAVELLERVRAKREEELVLLRGTGIPQLQSLIDRLQQDVNALDGVLGILIHF